MRFLGSQRLLISPRQLEDPCPRLLPVGLRKTILFGLCRQAVGRSVHGHKNSDDVRIVDIFVALLSGNCNHWTAFSMLHSVTVLPVDNSGSSSSWPGIGHQARHRVVLTTALRENLQPNAPIDECQAPVFYGFVLAILFAIRMCQNLSDFRIVLFFLETKRRIPSYANRHHSFLFCFGELLCGVCMPCDLQTLLVEGICSFCSFYEQLKTYLDDINLRIRDLWITHNQTLTRTSCSSVDFSSGGGTFGLLACLRPDWMTLRGGYPPLNIALSKQ